MPIKSLFCLRYAKQLVVMQNETNPLYPKDPIHDSSVIKIPLSYIPFMYDWRG